MKKGIAKVIKVCYYIKAPAGEVNGLGSVVQLVRTPACHAGGRGFEPHPNRQNYSMIYASVAQLVEQRTENPRVVGSIPTGGTNH